MPPVTISSQSLRRLLRPLLPAICLCLLLWGPAAAQDMPAVTGARLHRPVLRCWYTESGMQPTVITVTVGSQVTWINSTGHTVQLASQPLDRRIYDHVYLPLVTALGRSADSYTSDANGDLAPAALSWESDPIAKGGQYGRLFAQEGSFNYFSDHVSGIAGTVVVVGGIERLAVAPDALLLTAVNQTKTLAARAYDAAGNEVFTAVTWSSSNPEQVNVDGDGRVTALTAVGSALVYAHAGDLVSPPVTVLLAQPNDGVLMVPDAQVNEQPQLVDPAAGPGLGALVHTVLQGGAAPAPGQILLGTEGSPLMGKVVAVQPVSAGFSVTLETVSLVEVFRNLSISETLNVNNANLVFRRLPPQAQRLSNGRTGASSYAMPARQRLCKLLGLTGCCLIWGRFAARLRPALGWKAVCWRSRSKTILPWT